jgi:hypothetical protein
MLQGPEGRAGGGAAARPGAAARAGRVGAVLRQARVHHDPAGTAGAADRGPGPAGLGRAPAWGRGYRVHVRAWPGEVPATRPTRPLRQVNAQMERWCAPGPSQYLWGYARYKTPRGAGLMISRLGVLFMRALAPLPLRGSARSAGRSAGSCTRWCPAGGTWSTSTCELCFPLDRRAAARAGVARVHHVRAGLAGPQLALARRARGGAQPRAC